jgi:hypothetical protein
MSASWFKHDVGARRDLKIIALKVAVGRELYSYWWELLEVLAEQAEYTLKRKFLSAVAVDLGLPLPELERLIAAAVECELLVDDGTQVWSAGLRKRFNQLESVRASDRERKAPKTDSENFRNGKKRIPENSVPESSTLLYSSLLKSNSTLEAETPPPSAPKPEPAQQPPQRQEPPPDPYAKYRKHVDKFLKVPTEPPEPWQSHVLHINAGKRPCIRAELVWFTPQQLVEVFKLYEDTAGKESATELFYDALRKTQADAQAHVDQGRPLESFKAYNHMTSWKLQDAANTRAALSRMTKQLAKEMTA